MALDIRSVSGTSFQSDTKLTTKKESTSDAPSFQTSLDALQQKKLESLSFSKHAAKRMDERNIPMNDSLLGNLEHAVDEARKKGAKDVAVIGRQGVFIVNVPNNVVVTTMSEDDMKNRTVTNIDSAVFM